MFHRRSTSEQMTSSDSNELVRSTNSSRTTKKGLHTATDEDTSPPPRGRDIVSGNVNNFSSDTINENNIKHDNQKNTTNDGVTCLGRLGMKAFSLNHNTSFDSTKTISNHNTFFQPLPKEWELRGKRYLSDRKKYPSTVLGCEMIAVDHFAFSQDATTIINSRKTQSNTLSSSSNSSQGRGQEGTHTTKLNFAEHPESLVSHRQLAKQTKKPFLVPIPEITRQNNGEDIMTNNKGNNRKTTAAASTTHHEINEKNTHHDDLDRTMPRRSSAWRILDSESWILLLNFVLPWGSVVAYAEIPKEYIKTMDTKMENQKTGKKSQDKLVLSSFAPHLDLWRSFLCPETTNAQRNKILKTLISVKGGSYFARSGITPRPMLIGKGLDIRYYRSEVKKYFEITLNVSANSAARVAIRLCQSSCSSMTFSFCFCLQGENEEELPEQVLASFGIHKPEMKKLPKVSDFTLPPE
eukprot:g1340.t1